MIHPSNVKTLWRSGTGDMGDLTDRTDPKARFAPGERFAISQVRVHFTASTDQGDATLTMRLDSGRCVDGIACVFDMLLDQWLKMGHDAAAADEHADLQWPVNDDELRRFVFEKDDQIVLIWTDPGTTDWAIQFDWLPVEG